MKFFAAATILLLALFLQLFLASAGWYFNIALAALIAFTFTFDDIWELLTLDLLAVFILNWKPAPSTALLAFALIPFAAFVFRKLVHSERWIGNLIAIVFGFLIFYLAASPTQFLPHILLFLEDVLVAFIVGEVIFFGLT